MKKIQVYLSDAQNERLERLARSDDKTRSALVREAIEEFLGSTEPADNPDGNPGSLPDMDVPDEVMTKLLELYHPSEAEMWLTSFNAHLGGRPIDVLQLRGVEPVLDAIAAEAGGAYA